MFINITWKSVLQRRQTRGCHHTYRVQGTNTSFVGFSFAAVEWLMFVSFPPIQDHLKYQHLVNDLTEKNP